MIEENISNADIIRQILRAATTPLSGPQIFALSKTFEGPDVVSKGLYAMTQRGETIRTDDAKGKPVYVINPNYHKSGVQPGPAASVKATKTKPAKAKAPPKPAVVPEPDPIDDEAIEDNAVFAINDQGVLAITNGEGMPTTLEPFQIARLYTFMDTTAALWSVPE